MPAQGASGRGTGVIASAGRNWSLVTTSGPVDVITGRAHLTMALTAPGERDRDVLAVHEEVVQGVEPAGESESPAGAGHEDPAPPITAINATTIEINSARTAEATPRVAETASPARAASQTEPEVAPLAAG